MDFFYVDRLLANGGVVVIDDLWLPAVRKLVAYVRANRDYVLVRDLPGSRPGAARAARRVLCRVARSPLQWDRSGTKLSGRNACVLRRGADDARPWDFHRRVLGDQLRGTAGPRRPAAAR